MAGTGRPPGDGTWGRGSNKSWHVLSINGAKTDDTRQRRIAKSVEALREGRIR